MAADGGKTSGTATRDAVVIWQARPTVREMAGSMLLALLVAGVYVVLLLLIPPSHPATFVGAVVPPAIDGIRSLVVAVRGRVVLRHDGIEVRRVRTRLYPWDSLLSLTVEEDGRIEITPKGWVRKLPIPRSEVPEAFATITRWRDAALEGRAR